MDLPSWDPTDPPPALGLPGRSAPESGEADAFVEGLVEDMTRRWRGGQRPVTEEYLERYPVLWNHPEAALELIYEEISLREQYGPKTAAADWLQRFPRWERQLRVLLDCHGLLGTGSAVPDFPAVGEVLGDFRLLAELGRGAHGKAFVATQMSLAGRPVVLKLAPAGGREHLSLARLQHTHIVPLHSVQEFPARRLRCLCMPYFGGATLARVLQAMHGQPAAGRTGRHLLRALQEAQTAHPVLVPMEGPAAQFLARVSYVQAICWIGACLADALDYAHERGLAHFDLKPAYILLAADGQPMLLDFHLAREPIPADGPAPDWLGGTPGYMAPEHQAALAAVVEGRKVTVAVDGRADVYALGLVLYELLGGTLPAPPRTAVRRLRQANPQVSVGLADVLDKCLAGDPPKRYPRAAALAADLRNHLADLPLRGVSNRSLAERWRKWRRRRPYAPALLGLLLAILTTGALALAYVNQQVRQARAALHEGRNQLLQHEYDHARSTFQRGLALTEAVPFHGDLAGELRAQLRLVERAQAASELHRFVERIRGFYGVDLVSPGQAQAVEVHCHEFWQKRRLIAERLEPQPAPEAVEQIRTDLLDLAIVWADLRVRRLSGAQARAARSEALQVLADAEALFGPSVVLSAERQAHAAALGLTDTAEAAARRAVSLTPRTAWEHYALGRSLLRTGNVGEATSRFDQALELQPQGLWSHFYRGQCAYRLARYDDAVIAFTACVALAPDSAWCRYNRGLAYTQVGRFDRALRDLDRALALDPTLAAAALSRGMLHYREKRYSDAVADLHRALEGGMNPAPVLYGLALVHLAKGDRPAARSSLERVLAHTPEHAQARTLLERLRRESSGQAGATDPIPGKN
jgi:serine/threonine protein kinase/tetratricopeptide (TPR) repeat protein